MNSFSAQLYALSDTLETLVDDEHGKFPDHFLVAEDCRNFDRVEWLRDVAAKIESGALAGGER